MPTAATTRTNIVKYRLQYKSLVCTFVAELVFNDTGTVYILTGSTVQTTVPTFKWFRHTAVRTVQKAAQETIPGAFEARCVRKRLYLDAEGLLVKRDSTHLLPRDVSVSHGLVRQPMTAARTAKRKSEGRKSKGLLGVARGYHAVGVACASSTMARTRWCQTESRSRERGKRKNTKVRRRRLGGGGRGGN